MVDAVPEDFPTNLVEFYMRFGNEDACREYLMRQRWPDGYRCPRCQHERGWQIESRILIQCAACNYQASLTAGTIMHGSRKSLTTWFMAIWLVATRKTGLSAKALQRELGLGSYQTAWVWLHKLRRAMVRGGREPLGGRVEVDVTEITCEHPGRYPDPKVLVQVAVEDHGNHIGRVRMQVVGDQSGECLFPQLVDSVEPGSAIHTDGWSGYSGLKRIGFEHEVDVIGDRQREASEMFPLVHLVASLLKRWLLGTYQGSTRWFNLNHYLEEFGFRFNRRKSRSPGKIFMRLVQGAAATEPAPYKDLLFCQRFHDIPDGAGA